MKAIQVTAPESILRRLLDRMWLPWKASVFVPCYLVGLSLSFILLYVRLGSADLAVLGAWFNSDTLYAAHVYRDVFVDRFPLSGLSFPTAPSIFPDIVLSQLALAITPNVLVGTLIAGMIQYCLLVAAFGICVWAMGPARQRLAVHALACSAILITIIGAVTPSRIQAQMLFLPTTHVGALVMVAFSAGMALLWIKSEGEGRLYRSPMAIYAAAVALAALSDLLFVVQFVIPLTIALAICRYFTLLRGIGMARLVTLTWLAALAGYCSKAALPSSYILPPRSVDRSMEALGAVITFFCQATLTGHPQYYLSCACLVAAAITALWLLRRQIAPKQAGLELDLGRQRRVLFLLFMVLSAAMGLVAPVVAGVSALVELKNAEIAQRYALSFYLAPFFAWGLVAAAWDPFRGRQKWIWLIEKIPVIAAILLPAYLLAVSPKQLHPLHAPESPFPVVQELDRKALQFGLKYGIGGYWETQQVTLLSNMGLRAYPVLPDLSPFPALANRYWYCGHAGSRHSRPEYSFVLLSGNVFGVARETVASRFGEPAHEFDAGGLRVLVYNRPADSKFRMLFR